MYSTFPILICCLYALSAVHATPFDKRKSAEVQQGNAKAVKPLNFWSDDKSDDDDKDDTDDKWSKDGKDDKDNKDVNDECASRSVSVLIGTSTYAIPCLQGDSIVNLNGLIPTPTSSIASSSTEVSSSAVSSSASFSSEASSSADSTTTTTDSTTTTTDTITTTTDTTTSADSSPTFTVTLYASSDCTSDVLSTSLNEGCFLCEIPPSDFSVRSTSTTGLEIDYYDNNSCSGELVLETLLSPNYCGPFANVNTFNFLSYSVTII